MPCQAVCAGRTVILDRKLYELTRTLETFRRYLLAALDGMDDALISPSTVDRLARAAEQLPASFSQFLFGFECRLDDPEPLADFVVAASPRQNGKRVFVPDLFQSPPLAAFAETEPAWAPSMGLCRRG